VSVWRLITHSLRFYWRTGIVVAFGVAVAAAVITGSLLVGDSVSGSIRDTALSRLGYIDQALVAPHFFRESMLTHAQDYFIIPVVLSNGTAKNATTEATLPHVNVIGVDESFWRLFLNAPSLTGRQVAVNASLAHDLGVQVNDDLLLNIAKPGAVASDTLFARRDREDTLRTLRLQVASVLPDAGAGSFSLTASTETPRNLFVDIEWLRNELDKAGQINCLLAAYTPSHYASRSKNRDLRSELAMNCKLEDYGLKLVQDPTKHYLALQSQSVLLNAAQVEAAEKAAVACGAIARRSSVYLATGIAAKTQKINYAIVAGTDSLEARPDGAESVKLAADDLWLNDWAAKDLGAKPGESVTLSYLVPAWDGSYHEESAPFTVRGITPISPADRGLTPRFDGITNADTVDAWNPPFPIDLRLVTPRDDEYWTAYHATPKAFISLTAARKMWSSGPAGAQSDWVTAVTIALPPGTTPDAFQRVYTAQLLAQLPPERAGLEFRPVRKLAQEASKGSTDFGELFLCMSFFLVLAAAGLAGMLMRLLADRRAAEAGMLLACGFTAKTVAAAIFGEGLLLTVLGTLLGVPCGVLYAWAIMRALTTWWIGAVGTSALWLHLTTGSLIAGACSGLVIGGLAVAWGTRKLMRAGVLELLAGWQAMDVRPNAKARPVVAIMFVGMLLLTGVLLLLSIGVHTMPAEGAFFGGGTALLVAGLCACHLTLTRSLRMREGSRSLARLALRSAAANRGRSLLTIGLLASATFIIVAVAANTRDLSRLDVTKRASGAGGFSLRAITALPLQYDLGSPAGRERLGFSPEDEALFAGVEVVSLLQSPGEDISCLNIAKPTAPRVLGVSKAMIERGGFTVFTQPKMPQPWMALLQSGRMGIPAFCDADSAEWTLHTGMGQRYAMPGEGGRPVTLRFTGLLASSIFAGEVLVSEAQFRHIFPGVSAPRYFLLAVPPGHEAQVADALRRNLGDFGVEVQSTREVLNSFMRVQNTYLSTFLALGGLGVLLGTIGLIIALLRNAFERRREFAVMLATGFQQGHLARLLVWETAALLVIGLVTGLISAVIAVAPQLCSVESHVNWSMLIGLLTAILLVGLVSCIITAYAATRGRLLDALHEE